MEWAPKPAYASLATRAERSDNAEMPIFRAFLRVANDLQAARFALRLAFPFLTFGDVEPQVAKREPPIERKYGNRKYGLLSRRRLRGGRPRRAGRGAPKCPAARRAECCAGHSRSPVLNLLAAYGRFLPHGTLLYLKPQRPSWIPASPAKKNIIPNSLRATSGPGAPPPEAPRRSGPRGHRLSSPA
jgi:hypothetical protein